MKKLNERQKRFCQEYTKDLNGKQAAIRAGYSAKTAEVQASKLLRNPKVSEYLQSLMDKRAKKVELTAEDVLKDIMDTRDTCRDLMVRFTDDGERVDMAALNGRNKANELLGKHLRLFTEKMEVGGNMGVTIEDDL
jgi:phage terminase small subunit